MNGAYQKRVCGVCEGDFCQVVPNQRSQIMSQIRLGLIRFANFLALRRRSL